MWSKKAVSIPEILWSFDYYIPTLIPQIPVWQFPLSCYWLPSLALTWAPRALKLTFLLWHLRGWVWAKVYPRETPVTQDEVFFYFEPLASAFCFMTPDNRQNWFCTCRSTGKPLHWLENAFDEGLPTGSFRLSSAWISHSIRGTWLICISLPPYCLGFLPLVKPCGWQFWISPKISSRRLVILILFLPSSCQIKGIL